MKKIKEIIDHLELVTIQSQPNIKFQEQMDWINELKKEINKFEEKNITHTLFTTTPELLDIEFPDEDKKDLIKPPTEDKKEHNTDHLKYLGERESKESEDLKEFYKEKINQNPQEEVQSVEKSKRGRKKQEKPQE